LLIDNPSEMNTILLIEDELSVANLVKKGLEEDGYTVLNATEETQGFELLNQNTIHLVILDILLPKTNGLEICKKIRSSPFKQLPILMLTALASAENVVLGLDSGADDYLAKPFKLIELKARIRTLLRRSEVLDMIPQPEQYRHVFADLELDDYTKKVTRGGKEISLTSTEYRLLLMFLKNPQKVISRSDLLDEVWGINFDIGTNVVDVYVNYLRKKIDREPFTKLIHTVIGMGYSLRAAE
jgi:DNA-binding response OmpR family regulator